MPEQFIKLKGIELRLSAGAEISPKSIYDNREFLTTALGLLISAVLDFNGEIDTVEVSFRNYKRAYKVLEDIGYFWVKKEETEEKQEKREPVKVDKEEVRKILREVLKSYEEPEPQEAVKKKRGRKEKVVTS